MGPTPFTQMADRGFDLELEQRLESGRKHRLAPVDRIDARGYVSEPPEGGLPVLGAAERLVFASNNYLGLTADQHVQNAARQAAATVGTGAGGSRVGTGDTIVHHDLERLLAETLGTEQALAFPSGYTANVAAIVTLEPDVVFVDECVHASTLDGCRLAGAEIVAYDHCDPDALKRELRARDGQTGAETEGGGPTDGTDDESWLLVTDSVFSIDGQVAPLEALCAHAEAVGAWILVDESHATGLYAGGGGIAHAEGVADRVHIQTGSLSTALASQGGYVAGSTALINCLIDERPFAASAGLTPTAAAAASEALHRSKHGDARERLWENVTRIRDGLQSLGYHVDGDSQILPVRLEQSGLASEFVAALADADVLVSGVDTANARSRGTTNTVANAKSERPRNTTTEVTDPATNGAGDTGVVTNRSSPPDDARVSSNIDSNAPSPDTATDTVTHERVYVFPMATHTRDDIFDCLEAFQDVGEQFNVL
ncbi:aminotransferase class I/II-fold pyridoxal phosphate-dependent enzyme [Halobacteria archaeon AArc-curdl1]|uniref:Aminotransferase class I/II-fold pyridoxal phosphate-dependent enzyme n=1 Tax=Natronosalvus hydrolyticus TaxID=2979988 RepID=A0AAP2Z760_9EURY|nr:aminotransferase class I/II-fold pyridoxal phosphate-dependent enzyme [Halobacteria archaeon AArc-curdl1]